MPNIFFNTNRKDSQNNKDANANANAKWIELKEMKQQIQVSQLPFDVMSTIFDYVKADNIKTYRAAIPLVSKQWRRFVNIKDEQLLKQPALRDVEIILAQYLRATEKNQSLRDLIPYRKQQREANINRLMQMIVEKISSGKIEELLTKLHMIMNNSNNDDEQKVLSTVWNKIINAVMTMDELQSYIKKSIAMNHKVGAFPGHDNKLSMTERLVASLFSSKKSTTEQHIFALDCFLTGFENNNFHIDWRIDELSRVMREFSNSINEKDDCYEETLKLIGRYHAVRARYTETPILMGAGPIL